MFFSIPFLCYAQSDFIKRFFPEDELSSHYIFSHWSTKDGLPQNSINSIVQTKDGYIWLATQGGVVRFDGSRFTEFDLKRYKNLSANRIIMLEADPKGGLWILGEGGQLSYYYKDSFTNYSKQLYQLLGEETYKIRIISVEKPNSVWLTTFSNVIHFDGKSFTKVTDNNKDELFDYSFFLDNDENLFKLSNFGLSMKTTSGFKDIKTFSKIDVNAMTHGPGYSYFIGTNNGLFKTNAELQTMVGPLADMKDNIFTMSYDQSNDELWYGLEKGGLWLFKDNKASEMKLPLFDNLQIQDIFIDNQDNIWIGTEINGLFRLNKRMIYSIHLKKGKFNDIIYPILKTVDNSIWVGANCGGIARIAKDKIFYNSLQTGLVFDCIWSLYQCSSRDIYIGGITSGIQRYSNHKFSRISGLEALSTTGVFAINEDKDGALWLGTDKGVYHFYKNSLIQYSKSNSKLPGDRISAIVEDDDGTLWFATDNGLGYYKNGEIGSLNLGNGKDVSYVRSVYIDKNKRMWLGTYGNGLIYYFNGKSKIITTENGLYNNYIHSTIEDNFGNFWMPTNNGLFRVKKSELIDLVEGKTDMITSVVVTRQNTITNDEFNGGMQPSYAKLDDGTILLPTLKGLAALDFTNFHVNNSVPKVHIESFIVDGKKYSIDSAIVLPPGNSEIEINFTALDFSSPDDIRFKYKIEELDKDWSSLKKERVVTYKHLTYGKYRFRVIARNADGVWNNEGSSIDFEIEATLFQTLWFKLFILFLLIFLITGYYSLRLKLQKKRALQLEKIVEERTKSLSEALEKTKIAKENEALHRERAENLNNEKTELLRIVSHNLKNPIGAILSSSEFVAEEIDDKETVLEMTKIMKNSAAHMLESVTQLLQSSYIEELGVKLEISKFNFIDAVEKVIGDNSVTAAKKKQEILFKPNSNSITVKADYEKILICIDNYINNAIKYSFENSVITVTAERKDNSVIFKVIDQGPGIKDFELSLAFGKFQKLSTRPTGNESSTGLGLSIVKRIIELHNGKIGVESTFGEGSVFYFVLPINNSEL